jgi:hypothetical protein
MTNDHLDSFLNSSPDFQIEARLGFPLRVTTMMRGFISDLVVPISTPTAERVTLQIVAILLRFRDYSQSAWSDYARH